MGRSCGTYGDGERWTVFSWGNLRERDHLEELGVDGRIILKWTFKKYKGGVNGIYLAEHVQDFRDHLTC
jgi:hypothetical protein